MNKVSLKYINLSLIIISMIVGMVGTAYATTITVDDSGGADYTTIGAAVSAANTGDTILVNSGTYDEQVNVYKQLTIQGLATDGTVPIIRSSLGSFPAAVYISTNDVIFEGFYIENIGNGIYVWSNNNIIRNNIISSKNANGISITERFNNTVRDNTIVNSAQGIGFWYSDTSTIINNTINGTNYSGINIWNSVNVNISRNNVSNANASGISISRSRYNTIRNNNINNNRFFGVSLSFSDNNDISDNILTDNRNTGIRIADSNGNDVLRNTATGGNCGITACHSSNNNIKGNIADGNSIGISLLNISNNNQIIDNEANSNTLPDNSGKERPSSIGIYLHTSDNNLVRDNTVRDNPKGIKVNSSSNNDIYNNLFNNSINYLLDNSIDNRWNTTENTGINIIGGSKIAGNYWATPSNNGFSQTCINRGDGICNDKYELDSQNIDYLPLTTNAIQPLDVGTISISGNNVIAVTGSVATTATITGSGSATATWNWDDSMSDTVPIEILPLTLTGNHQYMNAGVYTIRLSATDTNRQTDAESYRYVVVYDPSAGFVTGGGWIDSPAGAYVADKTLAGRANFGFVSKYKQGDTTPTGQTEFQFQLANFNFHSDNYEWLVVAGAKAQYKGTGTVNGDGNYGFLLTATDGQITGGGGTDKFRIKIVDKITGNVVYDNVMGESDDIDSANPQIIARGSIVIHKK